MDDTCLLEENAVAQDKTGLLAEDNSTVADDIGLLIEDYFADEGIFLELNLRLFVLKFFDF